MPPLTWKTVDAPNLSRAALIMNQAAQNFTSAGQGIGDSLRGLDSAQDDTASARGLQLLAGISNPGQVDSVLAQVNQAVAPDRMTPALQEAMLAARDGISVTNTRNSVNARAGETHRRGIEAADETGRLSALMAGSLAGAGGQARAAAGINEREQQVISGLMARGMSEAQAIGAAAGMNGESGLNPGINERNPVVPGSRGGFGLNQWTGPRREAYEAFAASTGKPVDSMETGLDFTVWELNNSENAAGAKFYAATDPTEAARIYTNDYLRPGINNVETRVQDAARMAGSNYIPDRAIQEALASSRYQTPDSVARLNSAGRDEYADVLNDTFATDDLLKGRADTRRAQEVSDLMINALEENNRSGTALTRDQMLGVVQGLDGLSNAEQLGAGSVVDQYLAGAAGVNTPAAGASLPTDLAEAGAAIDAGVSQVGAQTQFSNKTNALLAATQNADAVASAGNKLIDDLNNKTEIKDAEGNIFDWSQSENDVLEQIEEAAEQTGLPRETIAGLAASGLRTGWFDSVGVTTAGLVEAAGAYANKDDFLNLTEEQRQQQIRNESIGKYQQTYAGLSQEYLTLTGRDQNSPQVQERMAALQDEMKTVRDSAKALVEEDAKINRTPEEEAKDDAEAAAVAEAQLKQATAQRRAAAETAASEAAQRIAEAQAGRRPSGSGAVPAPGLPPTAPNRAVQLLEAAGVNTEATLPESMVPFVNQNGTVNRELMTRNLVTIGMEMQDVVAADPVQGEGAKAVLDLIESDAFRAQLESDPELATVFFQNPEKVAIEFLRRNAAPKR